MKQLLYHESSEMSSVSEFLDSLHPEISPKQDEQPSVTDWITMMGAFHQ